MNTDKISKQFEKASELFKTIEELEHDEYGEALGQLGKFIESMHFYLYSPEFIIALQKEVKNQVDYFNANAKIIKETKTITHQETITYIEWGV